MNAARGRCSTASRGAAPRGGAVAGRRVLLDVPGDAATEHVPGVLASCGADVVADPSAELVVHPWQVGAGDAAVDVPLLDPTGERPRAGPCRAAA